MIALNPLRSRLRRLFAQHTLWVLILSVVTLTAASIASGAEKKSKAQAPAPTPSAAPLFEGEQVNIDAIKERYWARGDESEMGVVQNRLYRKERKFELGIFGGSSTVDPFLNVRMLGATLGYHFSEYLAFNAVAYRAFASASSAYTSFQNLGGSPRPPTNDPRLFMGAEFQYSPLYGKLSLVGKKIIYYDMHVIAGGGRLTTESDNFWGPTVGLGQQVYLAKWMSLRLDYRMLVYSESLRNKNPGSGTLGQITETRTNYTHNIMIGLSFLLGFESDKETPK